MPSDFESARKALGELFQPELDAEKQDRNEATTRLQLVDSLLFRCLGWDVRDCLSEHRYQGKIADYSLGNPMRLAIWEAKREGVSFVLPAGFNQRVCKIATVSSLDKEIEEAIRQVLSYCSERGVGIAVVCNGHQVIAFLASRYDGVPPLEGVALVFGTLEEMFSDFRVLWDNLSKPGTENRNIYKTLRSDAVPAPPEKLSARISNYPGFKNRNPFQTELKNLGELFIEDIGKTPQVEEEFLKACYSTSGALSQYALVSKQLLESRYSAALQSELGGASLEPVSDRDGNPTQLKADVVSAALRRRPIILLGDVGVGKTMFLRYLIIRLEDDQTKGKEAREIPLPSRLVVMLERIEPKVGLVFDTTNIRKHWQKACTAVGLGRIIEVPGRKYDPRYEGLTVHDFRRSAIRNLVTLAGVREKVAMEITGHKTRSVFDRYHIVDTTDVSNAMRQWEATAENLLPQRNGAKLACTQHT